MTSFTDKPWDGSASRFADSAAYCKSCLIDLNPPGTPAEKKTQQNCKLPVREPDGTINKNALSSAAGALAGGRGGLKDVPASEKAKAATALKNLYDQAKMDRPKSLGRMGK